MDNLTRDNIIRSAEKIQTLQDIDYKGIYNTLTTEDVKKLPNMAYDKLAEIGVNISRARFWSLFLTSIVMCIVGYILFRKQDLSNYPIVARVVNSRCINQNTVEPVKCSVDVQFKYKNKIYNRTVITNQVYKNGDEIVITADVRSRFDQYSNFNWVGIVLMGAAIVILIFGITSYYTSTKSKLLAAAEGTGSIIGTVNNLLKF